MEEHHSILNHNEKNGKGLLNQIDKFPEKNTKGLKILTTILRILVVTEINFKAIYN